MNYPTKVQKSLYKILAKTSQIGQNLIYVPSCHSTNDICADLLKKNATSDGTIVITDNQTAGKGQANNSWESDAGQNLTVSIICNTSFLNIQYQFYLNIVASLSVSNMIDAYIGPSTKVKWPNDVYVGSKKIGGILIQNSIQGKSLDRSIMGFGVNVNQQSFSTPQATSLNMITGRSFLLNDVLNQLVKHLDIHLDYLRLQRFDQLKGMYLQKLYWKTSNIGLITGKNSKGL